MIVLVIWAIVGTVVSGVGIRQLIMAAQKAAAEKAEHERQLHDLGIRLEQTQKEIDRRDAIAAGKQEAETNAKAKKKKIRSSPDAGGRARAATDAMSNGSGASDSDADGGAAGN